MSEENLEQQAPSTEVAPTPSTEPAPSTEPEQYSPNYKFSVMDKEFEFDDRVKPLIKSKTDEDYFRDIYTKAHGFEPIKQKYGSVKDAIKLKDEYEKMAPDAEWAGTVKQQITQLDNFLNKKDFESFRNFLGIPKEMVLQWAVNEAKYREMPAEQRAQLDAQRQRDVQLQQYEQQNSYLEQQYTQFAVQARTSELNMTLMQPQVSEFSSKMDTMLGREGAFRDEVVTYAKMIATTTGKDLSAQEAVDGVMKKYGVFLQGQQQQVGTPQVVQKKQGNVLPSIQGGATSPARQKINSLDDLRKLQKTL